MVEAVSTNEVPGPKQPPRIHGDGCTCGDFARYGCPAAATYKPTASQEALTKDQEPKCIHFGKKTTGGFVQLGQAVPWACPWCHIASLTARCRELESDRARLEYWLGDGPKDTNEFLRGVREHWTIEQWRTYIDAQMGAKP